MNEPFTPDITEKMKKLIDAGISESTKRAYRGDVRRFWQWAKKTHSLPEHYPVNVNIMMNFLFDHLEGKHGKKLKIVTLKRYLTSLSVEHLQQGFPSILANPQIKLTLRRARRALPDQQPHQKVAATADILRALVSTCDDSLRGIRDMAIMLLGFSAGGRRRDELASLTMNDIQKTDDGYLITITRSKTDQKGKGLTLPVNGEAAQALSTWLMKSGIREGHVFRGIRNNGGLNHHISGRSICRIIQRAAEKAGFDARQFGGHSLRAGFMTEAVTQNVPLPEAMVLSGHKTLEVAQAYYRDGDIKRNRANNLLQHD